MKVRINKKQNTIPVLYPKYLLIFLVELLLFAPAKSQDISAGITLLENLSIRESNYKTKINVIHNLELNASYSDPESDKMLNYFSLRSGFYLPDKFNTDIEVDSVDNNYEKLVRNVESTTSGFHLFLRTGISRESNMVDNVSYYTGVGIGFVNVRFKYELPDYFTIIIPQPDPGKGNIFTNKTAGISFFYGLVFDKGLFRINAEIGMTDWFFYNFYYGMDSFNKMQITGGIGISVPLIPLG